METNPVETWRSGYQKWLLVLVTPAGIHHTPAVLVDTSVDTPRLDTKTDLYTTSKKLLLTPLMACHPGEIATQKCKRE